MPDRPNVLFVMDDQHSARCLGCYGNDIVRTPAIDDLAAAGTRFDRAYCNNPICMPSRMSFLTGRYPNAHGVYGNYGAVPDDTLSLAHHFRRNGYVTGGFGKLHLPVDWATHGFDVRRLCDFADTERHPEENDYYAYLERVGLADDYDLGVGSRAYPYTTFVSNIPAEHSVERWTADETLEWLRERDAEAPFFAWMSFQRPHPPYAPPPEYADRYDPDDVVLPPREDDVGDKPEVWQRAREAGPLARGDEDDLRQIVAHYYALITLIDEQIGRVVDYLRATGELANTVVVFASDHGDFAGEHGLVRKNVAVSEAVHRIPLVWRWPERVREGAVVDDLVESVDLFPTLCDLLGLPTPDPVQGRSLAGALADGDAVGREAVVCETQEYRTVRTEEWKLTRYVGADEGELYRIDEDPWEHENRYGELPAVRAALLERLVDHGVRTEEPAIPGDQSVPREEPTEAHHVWMRPWWEHGGRRPSTPLSHLGAPGSERSE